MFIYKIQFEYQDGYSITYDELLTHDKEFSTNEFNTLCAEAKSEKVDVIANYLITHHGFKRLKFTAEYLMVDENSY